MAGPIKDLFDAGAPHSPPTAEAWAETISDRVDEQRSIDADLTVTVGGGGDFPTINAALVELSKRKATYTEGGFTAEVNLLSGFVMGEQVLVDALDLGWIRITSQDVEVTIQRDQLTDEFVIDGIFPAFGGQNGATLPVIDVLFDMDTSGTATERAGVAIGQNSSVLVANGAGVKNSGGRGLYIVSGSRAVARNTVFTGSGNRNVWVSRNSQADLENANVSGSTGSHNVYVSRASTVHLVLADATNAAVTGIVCTRSFVNANAADVSGAGDFGALAERGAFLAADNITASGCGRAGVRAEDGSELNLNNATVSNNTEEGILAFRATLVNAVNATVTGNNRGIRARFGSTINADGASVTGSTNEDLRVEEGSFIVAIGTDTTNGTGSPDLSDTNVSSFNSIDSNNGVIWV